MGDARGHHLRHGVERDAVGCDGVGFRHDGVQPVAGTMLSAGANQALQVTFMPADTTDYTTATGTVYITVNQESTTTTVSRLVNPSVVSECDVHGHGQRDGVRCRHADRHGHFPGRRPHPSARVQSPPAWLST